MSLAFARRLPVAALAAGIVAGIGVLPGVASTAAPPNLLKNGNAERGPAVADAASVVEEIPGWTRTGNFTVVKYDAPGGFPEAAVSTKIAGGNSFFAGGPANPNSGASQTVSVASRATAIDAGKFSATLAGYLGGYSSQRDSLTVTATFLDASGKKLGVLKIGPVTPAQRASETTMIKKSATGRVPAKTRSIKVALIAVRTDGSYNDGYAENLKLTLARA